MLVRCLALAFLALLTVPAAQACVPEAEDMEAVLELKFDHGDCSRANLDACPKLPEADAPLVFDGLLTWASQTDKACSVGGPSVDPVTINLEGVVRTYAGWLDLGVDPREIIIPVTDQYTGPTVIPDPNAPLQHGRHEYPVTVTISLVGEPSPEALDTLDHTGGAANLFLKAKMGATAAYTAQFTLESFLLDGRSALEAQDDGGRDVPALSPTFLVVALVGLAALGRRN